jgi:hypothetical protein
MITSHKPHLSVLNPHGVHWITSGLPTTQALMARSAFIGTNPVSTA